jgi:hypothetical protein
LVQPALLLLDLGLIISEGWDWGLEIEGWDWDWDWDMRAWLGVSLKIFQGLTEFSPTFSQKFLKNLFAELCIFNDAE